MSKKDDNDITFVITTNPLASSAANKERVRSVAALKSWPERRKRTFEHSHSQNSGSQGGFVLDLVPATPRQAKKAKIEPKIEPKAQQPDREGTAPLAIFSDTLSEHRRRLLDDEPLFEKCTRATSESCECVHCRAERTYYNQTRQSTPKRGEKRMVDGQVKSPSIRPNLLNISPPTTPGPSLTSAISDSGNHYPVPYQGWFDYVLHHMMNVFAPRGWPTLKITNAEGRKWEWFITQHALSEPALFYVRLLFATGDLLRLGCINPDLTQWLRTQAVEAINEALSDPDRATSDALILAVGRIALHESLYGDRKAANTVHRPGQKRMITMRGGMKALPFPELIKRLMRWGDTIMSKQSDSARLLEDDEENVNFSMKQHVDVLEKWVPSEGQELWKKIKIADLLSPEPSEPP